MPQVVATGQVTIVDNNDAKPITAVITPSISPQQIYSKDESSVVYTPNYVTTPMTLTAKVYVGGTAGAVDITAQLTNRKWSIDQGASLGAGTTLAVNTNMTTGAPSRNYYFEGDYTDPTTGLTSHVVCLLQNMLLQQGTNAVYVQMSGQDVIEQATGTAKNYAVMKADLIRASGVDDTGVMYQWFELPSNTAINQAMAGYATKYGFRTTAQANAGAGSDIGQGVPAAGFADVKAILISENAVNNIGLYRVDAKDADAKVFSGYFTIHDVSDPYTVRMISTSGDKLQNGVGSTNIYPTVYYGADLVADQTGWTFEYIFYDGVAPGKQAGFIDTTRTAVAGGRNITAHTAGAAAQFTYDGAAIAVANNDMIKVVAPNGAAAYYEVASGAGNTITVRAPATTSVFLSWAAPMANQFLNGKLFICTGNGATAGKQTKAGTAAATGAQITVTGDEIDGKGTIFCNATRP